MVPNRATHHIFKPLNNMNPEHRKIFCKTAFSILRPLNFEVNENHTTKYGSKILRCMGPHIGNSQIKFKKKLQ